MIRTMRHRGLPCQGALLQGRTVLRLSESLRTGQPARAESARLADVAAACPDQTDTAADPVQVPDQRPGGVADLTLAAVTTMLMIRPRASTALCRLRPPTRPGPQPPADARHGVGVADRPGVDDRDRLPVSPRTGPHLAAQVIVQPTTHRWTKQRHATCSATRAEVGAAGPNPRRCTSLHHRPEISLTTGAITSARWGPCVPISGLKATQEPITIGDRHGPAAQKHPFGRQLRQRG